jgi:exosortase E/protease (VPEID-CTERM system)
LCFDGAFRAGVPTLHRHFPEAVTNVVYLIIFSALVAILLLIGACSLRPEERTDISPFSLPWFGAHLLCLAGYCFCSYALAKTDLSHLPILTFRVPLQALFCAGVVFLALACLPLRVWLSILRTAGPLWLYLIPALVAAVGLRAPIQWMWNVSTNMHFRFMQVLTLNWVGFVLGLFTHNVVVDGAGLTIGISQFSIYIAPECSGLEGIGLVVVFELVWFAFFRRETRLPQAFLLIPASLACMWLLNVLRLAALIFIGYKISPEVALRGFHSQAGWIAFIVVALGFVIAWQNLDWARKESRYRVPLDSDPIAVGTDTSPKEQANRAAIAHESPATASFLVPFLAILATSFVSRAASGTFEWLYPLRFVVSAVALWHFRSEFRKLDWRIDWTAPVAGAAAFLVWVGPSLWTHRYAASPLGPALAALSPAMRWLWIVCRVLAAVITVPIAEELAFRGYLARRLLSREFDGVSFCRLSIPAIALSSVAFGLMHGRQWPAGILAGVAFAGVLRWRGRFGDAVAAHVVSNLLLALWVLTRGDWAQW